MRDSTGLFVLGVAFLIGIGVIFMQDFTDATTLDRYLIGLVVGLGIFVWIVAIWMFKDENAPITTKYLDELRCVGKEKDGTYSDRWHVSIVPEKGEDRWSFCTFNEVDGTKNWVRYVKTKYELQSIYKAIMDDELR